MFGRRGAVAASPSANARSPSSSPSSSPLTPNATARGASETPDANEMSLDELVNLGVVERWRFAGGAEREQPVDAQRQVMLDQPLVAPEVDGVVFKRRDDWQPKARDHVTPYVDDSRVRTIRL